MLELKEHAVPMTTAPLRQGGKSHIIHIIILINLGIKFAYNQQINI